MGKEHNENDIRKKMLSHKVRITTRISGTDKNAFFLDTLKKGITEAELNKGIIHIHYAIIKEYPEAKELELTQLKKYLIDKIKLK